MAEEERQSQESKLITGDKSIVIPGGWDVLTRCPVCNVRIDTNSPDYNAQVSFHKDTPVTEYRAKLGMVFKNTDAKGYCSFYYVINERNLSRIDIRHKLEFPKLLFILSMEEGEEVDTTGLVYDHRNIVYESFKEDFEEISGQEFEFLQRLFSGASQDDLENLAGIINDNNKAGQEITPEFVRNLSLKRGRLEPLSFTVQEYLTMREHAEKEINDRKRFSII